MYHLVYAYLGCNGRQNGMFSNSGGDLYYYVLIFLVIEEMMALSLTSKKSTLLQLARTVVYRDFKYFHYWIQNIVLKYIFQLVLLRYINGIVLAKLIYIQ